MLEENIGKNDSNQDNQLDNWRNDMSCDGKKHWGQN